MPSAVRSTDFGAGRDPSKPPTPVSLQCGPSFSGTQLTDVISFCLNTSSEGEHVSSVDGRRPHCRGQTMPLRRQAGRSLGLGDLGQGN